MSDIIRSGTFREGFEAGYRTVMGTSAGMPGTPGQPGIPGGSTAYLEGIKAGLKAAGVALPM